MTDENIIEHLQDELVVFKNGEIELTLQIESEEKLLKEQRADLEKLRKLIKAVEKFIGEKNGI